MTNNSTHSPTSHRAHAFTLIELLVVIAHHRPTRQHPPAQPQQSQGTRPACHLRHQPAKPRYRRDHICRRAGGDSSSGADGHQNLPRGELAIGIKRNCWESTSTRTSLRMEALRKVASFAVLPRHSMQIPRTHGLATTERCNTPPKVVMVLGSRRPAKITGTQIGRIRSGPDPRWKISNARLRPWCSSRTVRAVHSCTSPTSKTMEAILHLDCCTARAVQTLVMARVSTTVSPTDTPATSPAG